MVMTVQTFGWPLTPQTTVIEFHFFRPNDSCGGGGGGPALDLLAAIR
jgi:hypothetical protein